MRRFVEGVDRGQATFFAECLEDWICEDNPVRAVDAFVDGLDLAELGFGGAEPEATGRPFYHPSVLTVEDTRRNYGEPRFQTVGFLQGRMVMVVWTPRGAARHIISMRKCNVKEQARYRQRFTQG